MRWIFVARVTPERIPLSIGEPIGWDSEFDGLKYSVSVVFADAQVVADVRITAGNPDLIYLRNLVDLEIRSIIDAGAYAYGVRYDLDFISATSVDDGSRCVFGNNIPILADRKSRFIKDGQISSDILIAALTHTSVKMILHDFREAMRFAVGTGFYCYRAIETMKQHMTLDEKEKPQIAWDRLRSTLNVDRSAIDYVKSHADFPRHGKPSSISDRERQFVFQITDEIIARFLEFVRSKEKTSMKILTYQDGVIDGLYPS